MPELNFEIESAAADRFAAVPQLNFELRIHDADGESPATIQAVWLNVQIRIEPTRRRYDALDKPGLRDLFGPPDRWGGTMCSMLWTHVAAAVRGFCGETTIELPVACSFDFNVAATKYFDALEAGFCATRRSCSAAPCFTKRSEDCRRSKCRGRRNRGLLCRWLRGRS